MLRSMYSGVSGLRNHQLRMDAIGNNIANVNTVGYKSSRVSFQDALNQTFRGAAAPASNGSRGGINAMQIGLDMNVASVDVLQTQGNLQNTGVMTDCAIQGDGFFILSDGMQEWYTRAGNFQMDENGSLVNPSNGLFVRGWMANNAGTINTNASVADIQLPVGQIIAPRATTEIGFNGLLQPDINGELNYPALTVTDSGSGQSATIEFDVVPINFYQYQVTVSTNTPGVTVGPWTGDITLSVGPAPPEGEVTVNTGAANFVVDFGGGNTVTVNTPVVGTANGGTFDTIAPDPIRTAAGDFEPVQSLVNTTRVYDSLGVAHTITTTIGKTALNTWSWTSTNELGTTVGNGALTFDSTGKLIAATTANPYWIRWTPLGANTIDITPDFSAIRQNSELPLTVSYISPTEITSPFQDGYPAGTLQGFNIDKSGIVTGVFSNGQSQSLAQIAIANFTNPGGLIRSGDTIFQESNNSGPAQIGAAGKNGRGLITPGAIEMSNVDLSAEFTDMIVTERGFQSNSRIITTSDEMLQELVNLKR